MKGSDLLIIPQGRTKIYVAKEIPDRHYDKTIVEAHAIAGSKSGRLATLPEFADSLGHILRGSRGEVNVLDGEGERITESELTDIFNEVAGIEGEWRGEYVDFVARGIRAGRETRIDIDSKHSVDLSGRELKQRRYDGSALKFSRSRKLNGGLLDDREVPGIDFESWLFDHTQQGLPRATIGEGEMFYWSPAETATRGVEKVRYAVFNVDSKRRDLDLSWPGPYDDSSTGFRLVFDKKP